MQSRVLKTFKATLSQPCHGVTFTSTHCCSTALAANSSCRAAPSDSSRGYANNMAVRMVVHSCVCASPHTASTGWRIVCQAARPGQALLCAALLCTSTGQTRARWHRERPSASRAGVLNSPFSSRLCCWVPASNGSTRWTRCWWVRRDSCWFLLPCWEVKRSFIRLKRRVKRAGKGEAGGAWRHQLGRRQRWTGGGSRVLTKPAFTLQSSELTPWPNTNLQIWSV